jgi:hypothetical protein
VAVAFAISCEYNVMLELPGQITISRFDSKLGDADGNSDGAEEAMSEGLSDGATLGHREGEKVGLDDGLRDGKVEGLSVGIEDGMWLFSIEADTSEKASKEEELSYTAIIGA